MDLAQCPYCNLLGLVTKIRATPGGFEVTGYCRICGYGYDSDYEHGEAADDLLYEFSGPLEQAAHD